VVDYQFRIRKFESFMAVSFGVIVAVMDGRGTDANGDKFLKAVSKKLGEIETHDQLALVE
jgi:dipeptidyl aminopeptidase/acylaminoacyl peptidase